MPDEFQPLDDVARADLKRDVSFRADTQSGDGLTIEGYATVYDSPTRIDSWEGVFDEEFAYGSFARSIRGKLPKLQFDHGTHPVIGSIPIGTWESVSEEREGLRVVGRLLPGLFFEPVREAITSGAIDGMSIRFSVVREDWMDKDGKKLKPDEVGRLLYESGERGPLRRVIREAKISEAGPVVWPAYQQTSVGVRSVTIDLDRLTDPDQQMLLARAVFLADAANRKDDGPQVTEGSPDNHSDDESRTDPVVTEPEPDQHPSADARKRRDRMRAAAQRYRGYLLTIPDKD